MSPTRPRALLFSILFWLLLYFIDVRYVPELRKDYLIETRVLESFLFLFGAYILNGINIVVVFDMLRTRLLKQKPNRIVHDLFGLSLYLGAVMGIVGIVFEQSVTGVWATSGILGIVIGLALRPIILDFLAGLAISSEKPFELGDWITIHGQRGLLDHSGWVEESNWRTTRMRTRENNSIVFPNNVVGTSVITNSNRPEALSRYDLHIRLDPEISPTRGKRVIGAGVHAVMGKKEGPSAEKPPQVYISDISDKGVEYWIRYWVCPNVTSYDRAHDMIATSVLQHLFKAGISIAKPAERHYTTELAPDVIGVKRIEDRMQFLRRVELFEELGEKALHTLAKYLRLKILPAGRTLFHEGERGNSMYIVAEGLLGVTKITNGTKFPVSLAKLAPGDFVGEMSLITGDKRSATVSALTESRLLKLSNVGLMKVLEAEPSLDEVLIGVIARRRFATELSLRQAESDFLSSQKTSFANQLLKRMRSYLGVSRDKSRETPPLNLPPQANVESKPKHDDSHVSI